MADRPPLRRLLRLRLVHLPLYRQQILQEAQLVPSRLRLWPGRTPLHPNLVGHLRHRVLPTLGRRLHFRCARLSQSLAVAGRVGFHPRSWIRYHPSADSYSSPHVFRPHCISSAGFHCDYLRPSLRPQ